MKTDFNQLRALALIALSVFTTHLTTVLAQGTAFTYQGQLNSSGGPANGSFDLEFSIFNTATGGSPLAGPLTNSATAVSNGLFTVVLDFGAGPFNGSALWLEMAVRPAGTGSFTTLSPRQPLLPTPYAIFSSTASNVVSGSVVKSVNGLRDNVTLAAGANVTLSPSGNTLTIASSGTGGPWSLNGTSAYYNSGNVGVGTASPQANLHVMTGGEGIRIQGSSIGALNTAWLSFRDANGTRIGYVGDGSTGDADVFLESDSGDVGLLTPAGRLLTATASGNVIIAGDEQIGTGSGDYHHLRIGGGNSDGFLYGSYPHFGDGIHLGYNYYADASGNNQIIHPDGATSRISVGYGYIALATGGIGQEPVNRVAVDSAGNLRLGSGTQLYAPAGEENLRIMRGVVAGDGTPVMGCCFSVNHVATGAYDITFTTPFSGTPVITITPQTIDVIAGVASSPTANGFRALLRYNGNWADVQFHFIVMGPR
jgi:hypothetical protein